MSEYVLTTCISELRSALGEQGEQPRYLRTVHRTGYRLVVDDAEPAVGSPAKRSRTSLRPSRWSAASTS